ncbi:MAG TPA: hypothetical protein VE987_05485 [Polyangiaceae bacterium]|nr:hypothetical protein [Polyangiaceae bacterium]
MEGSRVGEVAADAAGDVSADAPAPDASSRDAAASDAADAADEPLPMLTGDCLPGGARGGSRWQDLYACYFGPTGITNCALTGECHGVDGGANYIWECDPTPDACWQGIQSLVTATTPSGQLYPNLRKNGGTGNMPLVPPYTFSVDDLNRIVSWLDGGALNN